MQKGIWHGLKRDRNWGQVKAERGQAKAERELLQAQLEGAAGTETRRTERREAGWELGGWNGRRYCM